jgi:hypothetical protein
MGEKVNFPLMKWERILDLAEVSQFTHVPSLAVS